MANFCSSICTNGPAVKFSRRCLTKYRQQGLFFSQVIVPVQGRHGAVFAVRIQSLLKLRVSGYKFAKWLVISPLIVNLLTVLARSGFVTMYRFVLKAQTVCKYRDKPINFTVRVSTSGVINCPLCRICLWSRMLLCFYSYFSGMLYWIYLITITLEYWICLVKATTLMELVQVD